MNKWKWFVLLLQYTIFLPFIVLGFLVDNALGMFRVGRDLGLFVYLWSIGTDFGKLREKYRELAKSVETDGSVVGFAQGARKR
jgi:hypothetical protein